MELASIARRVLGFARLLFLAGFVLSPSVSVAGNSGQWWLEVSTGGKTYRVRPDGSGWITLADPEGNEFCILSRDPAGSGATT